MLRCDLIEERDPLDIIRLLARFDLVRWSSGSADAVGMDEEGGGLSGVAGNGFDPDSA